MGHLTAEELQECATNAVNIAHTASSMSERTLILSLVLPELIDLRKKQNEIARMEV